MTVWIPLILLALAALLPLGAAVLRPRAARGRREADVALYRAQLAELDREREAGRLDEAGHRAARVEVQRRLIAAADAAEEEASAARSPALLVALVPLIAAGAAGLYLLRGTPGMPSAPYDMRAEALARDEQILATLRERLAGLDPRSEQARQGWVLLGNAERSRGRADAAIAAWTRAIEARFDAGLAGDIAEMEIARGAPERAAGWITRGLAEDPGDPRLRFLAGLVEAESGRPANARALWQALLNESPPDAPWRGLLERRLTGLP
ncbi:c-type cytochrome biogenesis protein CcmI [Roseomonas alkaliterrae]|jgi:cytochrome c-type biogenesis protein CcmH|uniref:Cytochrome c-type biogenesis protein CcmH n=1 Tax=Neoroseomonas alkaliterrae TaxID=1452450 RepID=A0A840XHL6_9PROT|nr:c-type cytochrome biogenesis protein CcmI [Neoroseomonas alkaliterrae]MBB5687948.1 cytochrome c-type biogenesis protein CcmH [Neoroseomonas alkaliterrae]MBR0676891.1 c-type cytochrome biogenesis protein CcmI [Neoroseomonas alkaliterrae]